MIPRYKSDFAKRVAAGKYRISVEELDAHTAAGEWFCGVCRKWLGPEDFYRNGSKVRCKPCRREKNREDMRRRYHGGLSPRAMRMEVKRLNPKRETVTYPPCDWGRESGCVGGLVPMIEIAGSNICPVCEKAAREFANV